MKIAESAVQMSAAHSSVQKYELKESLRMWVGDRRPDFEGRGRAAEAPRRMHDALRVTLSEAARAAQAKPAEAAETSAEGSEEDGIEVALRVLRAITEMFTGRKVKVFDPRELDPEHRPADNAKAAAGEAQQAPQRAGFGIEYDRVERVFEEEATSFSAAGKVTTADGRQISFKLELSMYRRFESETSESLRLGDAVMKDPLVLNFTNASATLSGERMSFDLDADGSSEDIARLAAGSGFLALDRNGNGSIDDGSELFGPKTGNGFAELAAHDEDGNGWIDETDSVFQRLSVWQPGAETQSLAAAGVGALYLGSASTPFSLKTAANDTLGAVRASGVYLNENGSAGSLQQIDLAV